MSIINSADHANNRFIREENGLRYFAAERSVYSVGAYDADHKICQISFARSDGSLFVSCPYFPHERGGILSVAKWPAKPPYTLSLHEGGKVTSHLVKFSHHPDGRVHFSQSGRIKTEIKRQSFTLPDSIGDVFQLHVYHVCEFKPLVHSNRKRGRAYLISRAIGQLPPAVTIAAQWRRKADIVANISPPGGTTGPISRVLSRRTGREFTTTFLGQPPGFPLTQHVLLVTCKTTDMLPNIKEPTMIFIGGYDALETRPGVKKRMRTSECLVWMYPTSSSDELATRIGTVDFQPPPRRN